MNPLREEITDAVIESVYFAFPHASEQQFRLLVQQMLCIVDHAAVQAVKDERQVRYVKNLMRSRN